MGKGPQSAGYPTRNAASPGYIFELEQHLTGIDRIQAFVAAWNQLDFNTIIDMMAVDIVYHNIPLPELNGINEVREFIQGMKADAAEWTIHAIAERNGAVLTERTDRFLIAGNWLSVRVMGIFEFNPDGRIKAWRDYFDLAEFKGQPG
jgi:limonene-1,2-epoxide hydrolase